VTVTPAQYAQLLKPINPKRVGKDGKNFSHVEAYDIRAHLNRIFGFLGWSAETVVMELVFESGSEDVKPRWTVCYRAQLRLTIINDEGFSEATYTEWATGDATNMPSRADAHDMALKTAESQALKRAAANLGDQFGLSLYAKGSTSALVGQTLCPPEQTVEVAPVDQHVTEQVVPENATVEPAPEVREKSTRDPQPVKATVTELQENIARIQGRKP
jgi:recombination DNA repair RAD52 pathway protein